MRISDWSSDVCSSDLQVPPARLPGGVDRPVRLVEDDSEGLVRAACRRQLHHLHAVEREAADGKPAGHEDDLQAGPVKGTGQDRGAADVADAEQVLDVEQDVGARAQDRKSTSLYSSH